MKEERTTAGDDDFDEKLFQSMLRNGAAFPTTPEEVRDASIVCKKILSGEDRASDNVVPMPPNEFAEVKQELARAARNGKEALSSKVEERMRMNRARAKCSNG